MLVPRIEAGKLADLAARREVLTANLGRQQLPRLASLLAEDSVPLIDLSVSFVPADEGLVALRIRMQGDLQLVCQRCLGPVPWSVRLAVRLVVLDAEEDAELLEDPFESVLTEHGVLELHRVIEDELLAAAPLAPRHEIGDDACRSDLKESSRVGSDPQSSDTSRPFAGLADILKASESGRTE
ncbi:MAG: YceD family protein [Gammaproteobacteria bacterium]